MDVFKGYSSKRLRQRVGGCGEWVGVRTGQQGSGADLNPVGMVTQSNHKVRSFRLEFCRCSEAFKPSGAGITQRRNLHSQMERLKWRMKISPLRSEVWRLEGRGRPPHSGRNDPSRNIVQILPTVLSFRGQVMEPLRPSSRLETLPVRRNLSPARSTFANSRGGDFFGRLEGLPRNDSLGGNARGSESNAHECRNNLSSTRPFHSHPNRTAITPDTTVCHVRKHDTNIRNISGIMRFGARSS